jgi:hypothetical protein
LTPQLLVLLTLAAVTAATVGREQQMQEQMQVGYDGASSSTC